MADDPAKAANSVHIAICCPHGSGRIPGVPSESYKRAILSPQKTLDGREIYVHELSLYGDEYARARNQLVEMVYAHEQNLGFKVDYLFWWDDDVVLPLDVLPKLIAHNLAIVGGIYFMRRHPYLPVAYKEVTDPNHPGRFWALDSYAENALTEVDAMGQGCVLVRREVYDKVPKPWFAWQEVERHEDMSFQIATVPLEAAKASEDKTLGEDLYFFTKARQAGYRVMLDSSVKCGHEGEYIFDESIFKNAQSRYHKIPPEGRLAILILAAPGPKPFDGNALANTPLGGSESAVAYLARELANRHHNIVYVASGSAPNLIDNVHYRPYEYLQALMGQPWDICIVSRWVDVLPQVSDNPSIKRVYFWAHDMMYPQMLKQIYNNSNVFVTLTPTHAAASFVEAWRYGVPRKPENEETVELILPNGVDLSLFAETPGERQHGKLVWTSNPNRGLFTAVRIFRKLRETWPFLELHVYGRSSVYGWDPDSAAGEWAYMPEANEPNVFVHEPLSKPELAKELQRSWAWFYPNSWFETSSIAALEAQAAGCPVIANDFGALRDTVRSTVLCHPRNFHERIKQLLDPKEYELAQHRGVDWATRFDWGDISDMWQASFQTELAKWKAL